jgi:hypothetical protein
MQKPGGKRKMEKFNFYVGYLEKMNKLNPFQFKKLVNALAAYADTGKLPEKLSNKAMVIFTQFQRVIEVEKEHEILTELRSKAGKKGMRNRWNNKQKQSDNKNITKIVYRRDSNVK